jgi:hypothetical protein
MSGKLSRVFMGTVKSQKIQLETLLRTSQHGDGMYLFIPKDVVDVYGLLPGDRVKVKLVESYRLIGDVEREKTRMPSEEKIESTLVVPKSKRRGRKRLKVTKDKFSEDDLPEKTREEESDQTGKTAEEEDGPLLIDSKGEWKEEG